NVDEAVKLAHIRDIEYMKNRPAKRVPLEKTSENTGLEQAPQRFGEKICPRCGKPLVLRTAKKGDHAGEQFYGCSGFPGCRYTEKA
ncbi:MAG: topoisomerase DNA-binding C4 zinc finger domain-containing protein, partial [bacterium]